MSLSLALCLCSTTTNKALLYSLVTVTTECPLFHLQLINLFNDQPIGDRPNTAEEESFWRETSPIRIFHPD